MTIIEKNSLTIDFSIEGDAEYGEISIGISGSVNHAFFLNSDDNRDISIEFPLGGYVDVDIRVVELSYDNRQMDCVDVEEFAYIGDSTEPIDLRNIPTIRESTSIFVTLIGYRNEV